MNLKRLLTLPALLILLLSLAQLLLACGEQTELSQAATAIPPQPTIIPSATAISLQPTIMPSATAISPQPTTTSSQSWHIGDGPAMITDIREIIARSSLVVIGKVSGLGEIVNYARDPNDHSKPDPNLFVIGQVYHLQVESYLKGQGGSNVDLVANEGAISGPDMHKTPLNFEQAKANDQHIPLIPGTRYLIFLAPSFFAAQHYFDIYKENWGYKLPVNGNAEIQSPNPESPKFFPGKPSAVLVTDMKQIISQNPTVAVTTMRVDVPTPTPNLVAKQTVNLVRLYGLDTAQFLLIKGRPIPDAKSADFSSRLDMRAVIASLNQDVTVLDNSSAADLSQDVVYMTFSFARDIYIGFNYNIKTAILSVMLPDKANWIRVVAPTQLLHATGLDNLGGPAPTLPGGTIGALPVASTVAAAGPNSASSGTGGIAAIKPHLNMANANTATNVATFTEDDVRQFVNAHPSWGLIKSNTPFTIEKIEFLSSHEATIKIATSLANVVGATPDKLLCLVTVRGSFAMAGSPPVPGQTVGPAKTFTHAFQLFDAQTGNLILMGGLAN